MILSILEDLPGLCDQLESHLRAGESHRDKVFNALVQRLGETISGQ
ncbi:MAG: hypothetical protein GY940_41945 [bacterium]|nr:hypothetical protein [bacterium]